VRPFDAGRLDVGTFDPEVVRLEAGRFAATAPAFAVARRPALFD
jgi:hypothetical protein